MRTGASPDCISLDEAVETFGHGFARLRSYTYPFECAKVSDRIWVLRDAPLRLKDGRGMEYLPVGLPPSQAIAELKHLVATHPKPRPGHRESVVRWAVSALSPTGSDLEQIKTAYKAAGFRYLKKEAMMARSLDDEILLLDSPFPVRRTMTQQDVDTVTKVAGRRSLLPHHLEIDDAEVRHYCAWHGDRPVGRVKSVRVGATGYVADMYVETEFRRQGIGKALLAFLLKDDQRLGVRKSVLLASTAGAMLYPHLGYARIGTLQIFSPPK